MSVAYLLDTDVIIDVQRNLAAATALFDTLDTADIAVPGYAALELMQYARNLSEARAGMLLVEQFAVVWPLPARCQRAVENFDNLHLAHGIGILDMLIAATALSLDATLYTFNIKHYHSIPELITAQPYARWLSTQQLAVA